MMKNRALTTALLLLLLTPLAARAQDYDFIRRDANVLHYDSTSPAMTAFFARWQRLAATGSGNLNIVHIGGSHVQAGTLSNTIRCNLLAAYPDLVASRGMLFPYSAAARCNNPADYRIHCREKMILTRCVAKEYDYPLGLCGIAVTAADHYHLPVGQIPATYVVAATNLINEAEQATPITIHPPLAPIDPDGVARPDPVIIAIDGVIHIEGDNYGTWTRIYDVYGQLHYERPSVDGIVPGLQQGRVYIVVVGNYAKKIIL